MKTARFFTILTVFALCFLFSGLAQTVQASTEISLGVASKEESTSGVNTVNRSQSRILQHSTGKIAVLSYDTPTTGRIKLYSSTGVLLASTVIPYVLGGMKLIEYSTTEILIVGCTDVGSPTSYIRVYWQVFNINTYSLDTTYYSTWVGLGGTDYISMLTEIYYYNGAYYCGLFWSSYYNAFGGQLTFCKFIKATHTASVFGNSNYKHPNHMAETYGFISPSDLSKAYIVTSSNNNSGDITTPECGVLDMSANTFTQIAVNGVSGMLPSGANTYDSGYTNMITFMGGGIYKPTGTFYYMYFTWTYSVAPTTSSPTVRSTKTVYWWMKFNNTVNSASLLSQKCLSATAVDRSGATHAIPGFSYGWISNTNVTNPIINVIYSDVYQGQNVGRTMYVIYDITNPNASFDSTDVMWDTNDSNFITYKNADDAVAKNPINAFSYHEVTGGASSYLYIGEYVLSHSYTSTISYSPLDNPLLVNKHYTFTYTIYNNNVIENNALTYRILVDGLSQQSGTLNNGLASIGITILSPSGHTLELRLYDSGNNVIYGSDVTGYSWLNPLTGGGTNPGQDIATGYWQILTVWVPIALIVFIPTIALMLIGSKFSTVGMVVGMLMGMFVGILGGVMTNILPPYALYLYLLILGICLVMIIRSG